MSVLDELREALCLDQNMATDEHLCPFMIAETIDEFEAERPGLVDETVTYECGKCGRTIVTTADEDEQRAYNRYCPACAKVSP